MAPGEHGSQWQEYLLLAVLNYNISFHSTLGCEPMRIIHVRIPDKILDLELGLNPNPKILQTTDFQKNFNEEEEDHAILFEKQRILRPKG